ncbi:hypothetical protein ACFFTK_01070 [Pseudonocardia petroleophila]|nr:hypothetical protein [Pseudonocardia petroleophila]
MILTSPPYLTRIDYGVAYARELAVLGIDIWGESTIRLDLMGTTLTRVKKSQPAAMSTAARDLLVNVSAHSSKASHSYYSQQAHQYVADLGLGLGEISRVSRPGAFLTLVVQDSYYKDVHVRLADICIGEAELRGWKMIERIPFSVRRSLVSLNSAAQSYKKQAVVESVIRLQFDG